MSGAANTLWARCLADELARAGVREVVLAPGSRSTPLVMAFAGDDRFRMRVHLDERSAAFFALGVGRASGLPAAVITTSGTAAANVFPAVVEASMSAVPMLVLTADRPHHLRDADANQAIDQSHLFGRYVRRFFEVAPPSMSPVALRHLRALSCRAVAGAIGPAAGPVHMNLPFDKPLEPVGGFEDFGREHPIAALGRADGAPYVRIATGRRAPDLEELDTLVKLLDTPRGVIVAGPSSDADRLGTALLAVAERTGFPVLADPLSGARYAPSYGAYRVSGYDVFLDDAAVAAHLEPTLIVRVGATPTSAALQRWLLKHDGATHLVIDGDDRWKDSGATATTYVNADATDTLVTLRPRLKPSVSEHWCEAWQTAETAALSALDEDGGAAHEGCVLATVARAAPSGASLFVSSSMPIRDLDAFAHPREEPLRVFGNRGASGIDGIVSTAFGVASQSQTATLCVIGDVAFFHDQNGLLWSREDDAAVVFVLIDNDGGGIFHMLPIAEHDPHFTRFFATPHGLDLKHAAELHGIPFHESTIEGLQAALLDAGVAGGTAIVRVRTERADNRDRHVALRGEARARAGRALAAIE